MSKELRVLVRLGDVPDGATVIKRSGSTEYVVKRKLSVYSEVELTRNPIEIHAGDGAAFLVGANGNINAYSADREVIWVTDLDTLCSLYEEEVPK